MSPPTAPFDETFDAIDLDSVAGPSRAAIEHAMAMCAPPDEPAAPGFYLLDDADGRFVVDRDFGVVSLKDAATLERERGQIRAVRLKVLEASGLSYELELQLRITGVVPQVVGQEAQAAALLGEPAPQTSAPARELAWTRFSPALAASAHRVLPRRPARYGTLVPSDVAIDGVCPPLVATDATIDVAPETADWLP